jgi:hypothetical protein
MTATRVLIGVLAAALASAVMLAQRPSSVAAGMDVPIAPKAITGVPSSARHCVSGQAANVHGLGWVEAGTNYTVTRDQNS